MLSTHLTNISNQHSFSYWQKTLANIETVIDSHHKNAYLLSPLEIQGIEINRFDRSFMFHVGPVVLTEKPDKFMIDLVNLYREKSLALISPEPLPSNLGFKLYVSGLLQCTVFQSSKAIIPSYKKTSVLISKPIQYVQPRMYLPTIYRWLDEQHASDISVDNILIMESLLSKDIPASTMPRIHFDKHADKVINGLDVVVSGMAAAGVYIENKSIKQTLHFPLTLLAANATELIPDIAKRLKAVTGNDTEFYTSRIDHPGMERYFATTRFRDNKTGKVILTLFDYPRFSVISVLEKDNIKYTSPIGTLIILHMSAWLLERAEHDFAKVIYAVIKRLRKVNVKHVGDKYVGIYRGKDYGRSYEYMETQIAKN